MTTVRFRIWEGRGQTTEDRGQTTGDRSQKKEERDSPVGAAFPDLPVPGVVPGSLSKVSRDLALCGFEKTEYRDSFLWERLSSRDLIDLNDSTDSNRNQRLLLHDLYQLTAFL